MGSTAYRPKFVLWTSFIAQLPFQIFFSIWGGFFLGGMFGSFGYFGRSLTNGRQSLILLIGLIVFFLFPIATLFARWLNYRNTTYKLIDDNLLIEEGFLTMHQKDLSIASIRELSLRRGVLQRLTGLGSIYLATQATGQGPRWQTSALLGSSSTFSSGAMLMDLPDYDAAYRTIRELVEAERRSSH